MIGEFQHDSRLTIQEIFLSNLYLQIPLLIYQQQIIGILAIFHVIDEEYVQVKDYYLVRTPGEQILTHKDKLIVIPNNKKVTRNDYKWS